MSFTDNLPFLYINGIELIIYDPERVSSTDNLPFLTSMV